MLCSVHCSVPSWSSHNIITISSLSQPAFWTSLQLLPTAGLAADLIYNYNKWLLSPRQWLCWPAQYALRTSVLGRDRLQCAVLVSTLWLAGTTTGARPSVAQSSLPSTPTLCQQWAVSSEQWGNRKKDFFIKLVWWVELVEELQSQTEFLFCLWEMLTIWNNFRSVSLSSEWTQYYLHDC